MAEAFFSTSPAAGRTATSKPSFSASRSRFGMWLAARQWSTGKRRQQGGCGGEIRRRLGDLEAAGDVEIDVVGGQRDAAARVEDGKFRYYSREDWKVPQGVIHPRDRVTRKTAAVD